MEAWLRQDAVKTSRCWTDRNLKVLDGYQTNRPGVRADHVSVAASEGKLKGKERRRCQQPCLTRNSLRPSFFSRNFTFMCFK